MLAPWSTFSGVAPTICDPTPTPSSHSQGSMVYYTGRLLAKLSTVGRLLPAAIPIEESSFFGQVLPRGKRREHVCGFLSFSRSKPKHAPKRVEVMTRWKSSTVQYRLPRGVESDG